MSKLPALAVAALLTSALTAIHPAAAETPPAKAAPAATAGGIGVLRRNEFACGPFECVPNQIGGNIYEFK